MDQLYHYTNKTCAVPAKLLFRDLVYCCVTCSRGCFYWALGGDLLPDLDILVNWSRYIVTCNLWTIITIGLSCSCLYGLCCLVFGFAWLKFWMYNNIVGFVGSRCYQSEDWLQSGACMLRPKMCLFYLLSKNTIKLFINQFTPVMWKPLWFNLEIQRWGSCTIIVTTYVPSTYLELSVKIT